MATTNKAMVEAMAQEIADCVRLMPMRPLEGAYTFEHPVVYRMAVRDYKRAVRHIEALRRRYRKALNAL